jgi:hypothetical protein
MPALLFLIDFRFQLCGPPQHGGLGSKKSLGDRAPRQAVGTKLQQLLFILRCPRALCITPVSSNIRHFALQPTKGKLCPDAIGRINAGRRSLSANPAEVNSQRSRNQEQHNRRPISVHFVPLLFLDGTNPRFLDYDDHREALGIDQGENATARSRLTWTGSNACRSGVGLHD